MICKAVLSTSRLLLLDDESESLFDGKTFYSSGKYVSIYDPKVGGYVYAHRISNSE